MSTTLADQIRTLLEQAGPDTVPGRLLAWWGSTDFPDGSDTGRHLTQAEWAAMYMRLENAALDPGAVMPLGMIEGATRDMRPDGPLPISIASFQVAVPLEDVVRRVRLAAANGDRLRDPPASLASAIKTRRVFAATGVLHDQWRRPGAPAYRGRDVTFVLDERLHLTNPGGALPDAVKVDLGDGQGLREVAWGEPFAARYAKGASADVMIRCRYGDELLTAGFTVKISDDPAPPQPDETWPLKAQGRDGTPAATGSGWVFRAPGRTKIVNPVLIVEGFPGRHPCDYLYELLNHSGTVDALHRAGYDLVIVGLDDGLAAIESNVGVLVECIREAHRHTSQPLVVGGVSMGGLISRIALAQMEQAAEQTGESHDARIYLSIDAPHGGTYTSLGVQWFVQSLRSFAPSLNGFATLLNSPSNQQLMIEWLNDGTVGTSPLRERFLATLKELGYPEQLRKLGVSCGRGDGRADAPTGTPALRWEDEPFVTAKLTTLPGDANRIVAEGSWFLGQPPELAPIVSDGIAHHWDVAPGSRNIYTAQVVAVANGFGCGDVAPKVAPGSCCVPTVSALDLDQGPFEPLQTDTGPFDACVCSEENEEHLVITPTVSQWILNELGHPPARARANPGAGAPAWDPYAFDPHDLEFLKDPYPTYARFRDQAPTFAVGKPPNASRWFFLYRDCKEILGNDDVFRKFPKDGLPPDANRGPITILSAFPKGVFTADPPDHDPLRKRLEGPLWKGFERAPALAEQYADIAIGVAAKTGYLEVVSDYALGVPANVLFDILGIPEDQDIRRTLILWQATIVRAHDKAQPDMVRLQGATAAMALHLYLEGLVRQYQQKPGQGVISELTQTIDAKFTAAHVYTSCFDFVMAGYLSTTYLIASAILRLSEPGAENQRNALAGDEDKVKKAIDELLRFEPPLQLVDRYIKEPIELRGIRLQADDKVTAVIASADRDDAVFKNPNKLDIDRANANEQMSFGDGIHKCIGAGLAARVAPVLISKLLRLPGLRIDGMAQWQSDPYLRGLESLPLRFNV